MSRFGSSASRSVQATRELSRVASLPRRIFSEEQGIWWADELTNVLKTPHGMQRLRPIQALALLEMGTQRGMFGPIACGEGKTLITGLGPYVLGAKRPLLLLPAKLQEKTRREFRILSLHWKIPEFYRLFSYELLGQVQSQDMLDRYEPDLIVFDEAHKLRHKTAARTRRVGRYLARHPETMCVAMSGTMSTRSIKDYAHILIWCLGPLNSPVPLSWSETEDWAAALDEKTSGPNIEPGALRVFLPPGNEAPMSRFAAPDDLRARIRQGFGKRLIETPGVIASPEKKLGCSLIIAPVEVTMPSSVQEAWRILLSKWETPDGYPLSDPMAIWRIKRELSLGFFYAWEPRGPEPWMEARKEWSRACREILTHNKRNLDSELQVKHSVLDGDYPEALESLRRWQAIEKTFTPNSVPRWIDDTAIKACIRWAEEKPGIIWVEHRAFALKLAKEAKLVYYGNESRSEDGRYIEDHPADQSLIASVASNAEGLNLQNSWSRNLTTSCPANGTIWEQKLSRTHRPGQRAFEVTFDVLCTSLAHVEAMDQAIRDARFQEAAIQQPQRLLYADRVFPTVDEVTDRSGHMWRKG